jgi:hypothetical protein
VVVRRRMIMQLTSLVDLLFIVMFLQYMELRDAAQRQLHAEATRRRIAETAQGDADRLKVSALANTADMTRRIADLAAQNQALQERLTAASKRLAVAAVEQQESEKRAAADLRAVAGVVKEMLGIPPESLVSVISGAPEAERVKLRQRLEELKGEPPGRLVEHLRETAELKKYCEIWEVRIHADNSVSVKIGANDADARFFVRSPEECANRLVALAKEHGEPKSLVIICLTWGDADLTTREQVINGLKFAVIALKPEWGGTKRIEFAKLGYADVP